MQRVRSVYSHSETVRMTNTDAAGVLYFAEVFVLAHACYESFLHSGGLSLDAVINEGTVMFLVINAEAEFRAPMRLGDEVTIELEILRIGKTSFTLGYSFVLPDGTGAASAKTTHVAVDHGTAKPVPLPPNITRILTENLPVD